MPRSHKYTHILHDDDGDEDDEDDEDDSDDADDEDDEDDEVDEDDEDDEDDVDILLQVHPRDLPHPLAVDKRHSPEVCRRLLRDHPQSNCRYYRHHNLYIIVIY